MFSDLVLDGQFEGLGGLLDRVLQFLVGEGRVYGFDVSVYGSVDGGGEGLPVSDGERESGTLVGSLD